jgi:hypothetical protein
MNVATGEAAMSTEFKCRLLDLEKQRQYRTTFEQKGPH